MGVIIADGVIIVQHLGPWPVFTAGIRADSCRLVRSDMSLLVSRVALIDIVGRRLRISS